MDRRNVYPSKRDGWLMGLIWVSMVLLLGAGVICFPAPGWGPKVTGVFSLATFVFVVWMLLRTDYTIEGDLLVIRSGPLRWRVGIEDIRSLKRTDDPSSSPALSLDRISVMYERKGTIDEILVSPADAAGFIAALQSRNPAIAVDGAP